MKLRDMVNKIESQECRQFVTEYLKDKLDVELQFPEEEIEQIAKYCKALSCKTRVEILYVLKMLGEVPVCVLAAILGKNESTISHSLRELKVVNLVQEFKVGKFRMYKLNDKALSDLVEKLQELVRRNSVKA